MPTDPIAPIDFAAIDNREYLARKAIFSLALGHRCTQEMRTRLDEARGLIKSMGVKPEMIQEAVQEALRAAAK